MTETKTCRAAGTAGLSLIAFFILPNAGCGKQAAQGAARTPSPTVVVVVETAERRDVPIMLELAARTEAAATVEVRSDAASRRPRAPPGRHLRLWWWWSKPPSAGTCRSCWNWRLGPRQPPQWKSAPTSRAG